MLQNVLTFVPFYYQIIRHTVDIPHFIYSSFVGHLGCFHLLAITIMLLWTFMCTFLCGCMLSFLLGRFLCRNDESNGHSCLTFEKMPNSFQMAASFYIPTSNWDKAMYKSSNFTSTSYCVFYYSHSSGCGVVFHCSLICMFMKISDVEHFFFCLLAIHIALLEKCRNSSPVF